MANVLVDENSLSSIASAIRAKNGTETTYKPGEMALAIENIQGGGDIQVIDYIPTLYGKKIKILKRVSLEAVEVRVIYTFNTPTTKTLYCNGHSYATGYSNTINHKGYDTEDFSLEFAPGQTTITITVSFDRGANYQQYVTLVLSETQGTYEDTVPVFVDNMVVEKVLSNPTIETTIVKLQNGEPGSLKSGEKIVCQTAEGGIYYNG